MSATATGAQNTAVGNEALKANTSGANNIAVGNESANRLTTGSGNVALGSLALRYATTGGSNNAIGYGALSAVTTASNNIGIGTGSGERLTTGANNIIIGGSAGIYYGTQYDSNTTGQNSVLIGFDVRPNGNAETNEIVISGYNGTAGTVGLGSNTTLIGSSTTTTARIMGALTLPNTTASSSSTTGALIVGGGVGIAKELNVGLTATITGATTISANTSSTSTSSGALKVTGGAGIGENLNVGGNTAITGTIKIAGGTPGLGKVLTSDANGLASWANNGGASVLTKTDSYDIATTDNANFIIFSGSATSKTIKLPSASTVGAGREITIKNIASATVAVTSASGNLISDSTTTSATTLNIGIEPSNNWIKAISDGTNWIILRALF